MREMLVYKYTQTMEYFSIQSVGLVWLTSNRMFGSGRIFKNTLGQFIPNRSRKHVITSTNFIDYTMWPTTLLVFYKVFTLTQCQTLRKVLMQLNPLTILRLPRKIVKHTQIILRLLPTNCLIVLDHFAGLALKGLTTSKTL